MTALPADRYGPPALTTPVFPLLPAMPPPQGLRLDDDDESVFVVVRWQGSGASYFRSAQVDRTRRARPARSIGGPDGGTHSARVPRHDDSNDARVRWDSRDGVSAFRNDACYLHPAATGGDRGEVHAFDSIADDDDDDEPRRGMASSRARHLPWEVRLAVCASRPGSIYGTTERVIGEGALNLADFVGTSKAAERRRGSRASPTGDTRDPPQPRRRRRRGDVVPSSPPAPVAVRRRHAIAGSRVEGGGEFGRERQLRQGSRREALLLPLRVAARRSRRSIGKTRRPRTRVAFVAAIER